MAFLYPIHLTLVISSCVVFTISFVTGVAFLMQENQLKARRLTSFVRKLPSLETMDSVHYKVLTVGFLLLSLGMIAGAILSKDIVGRFFSADPHEVGALVTWTLYAVFLNVRARAGWRGRKAIILSILGFAAVMLTFLGLKHRI